MPIAAISVRSASERGQIIVELVRESVLQAIVVSATSREKGQLSCLDREEPVKVTSDRHFRYADRPGAIAWRFRVEPG